LLYTKAINRPAKGSDINALSRNGSDIVTAILATVAHM
jgi:hypothetical protein